MILPAIVVKGQAQGCVTLHIGYGRDAAGPIGSGIGARVQDLGPFVTLRPTGERAALARVQSDFGQHGREILKLAHSVPSEPPAQRPSFYAPAKARAMPGAW